MKGIALKVTVVFAILMAALILWQLRDIVALILVSFAITAAMRAPIAYLVKRGLRQSLAITLAYVVGLGAILGLFFILGYPLTGEFSLLSDNIMTAYTRLQNGHHVFGSFDSLLAERLPTTDQLAAFLSSDQISAVGQAILDMTQNVSGIIGQFLLAMVLSIYWTADQVRFERFWLSLMPSNLRTRAREIWRSLEAQIGAYVRSEIVQSVLAGILLVPGFVLLGVQYPVIWALLISLAWFIPLVGGFIFLIPLWLLTWASSGALIATIAVLYTVAILALMEFVVERRLYTHTRYTNVLVILFMLMLLNVFGIVGLLIAPLVAITIEIFFAKLAETTVTPAVNPVLTPAADLIQEQDVSLLQTRLEEIRPLLSNAETPSNMRLANIAERLETLLKQAEEL